MLIGALDRVSVATVAGNTVTYAGFGADENTVYELGWVGKTFTALLFAEWRLLRATQFGSSSEARLTRQIEKLGYTVTVLAPTEAAWPPIFKAADLRETNRGKRAFPTAAAFLWSSVLLPERTLPHYKSWLNPDRIERQRGGWSGACFDQPGQGTHGQRAHLGGVLMHRRQRR